MRFNRLKKMLKSYCRNESGNATLILGLVAVPLISVVGLAVDMARIAEARSAIQQVADGAALAAAAAEGTDDEREAIGMAFATENMPGLHGVSGTPEVSVDGDTVNVSIATIVDATLLAVAFPVKGEDLDADREDGHLVSLPSVAFSIDAGAFAQNGEEGNYCLLALNTTMDNAIYIRGTGDFTATNCHVHSNSASSQSSIHLQGNAEATAEGFTAVGGWKQTGGAGWFSETPEGGKPEVADPIALSVSDPGGTAATATIKKSNGNVSLSAAKYSNITIQAQGQATFTSGVHYITGTLSIGSQGILNGTNVTLVLLGNNARIDMGSGATVKLQAPASGTYPGFAVIGDRGAATVQTNTVQGGASGYVRGIWYTPRHKLYITGNGDFNTDSGYFPVIVDNIEIGGNGVFNLGIDHTLYGYPEPEQLHFSQAAKARLTD